MNSDLSRYWTFLKRRLLIPLWDSKIIILQCYVFWIFTCWFCFCYSNGLFCIKFLCSDLLPIRVGLLNLLKCGCKKILVYGLVLVNIRRFRLVYYVSDVQNLYVHHLVHYVSADIWNSDKSGKFYPVVVGIWVNTDSQKNKIRLCWK